MRPDALQTLLKLRRRTVVEARTALADAIQQQDETERRVVGVESAIRAEADHAADPNAGDGVVEMFASWLPGARRRATEAQASLDHAVAAAADARTVLALARAALEAAETLETQARRDAAASASRREEEELDDAGRRRFAP